jgi:2-polyprenyl-6-hydroxyphenyl methylase/3-demethylubiquinone-9 3-methyltransferase
VEKGLTYSGPDGTHTDAYLERPLLEELGAVSGQELLDIGCGNGAMSASLAARGARVVGIDVSATGISLARQQHPEVEWAVMSAYDDLRSSLSRDFDLVVSLEVIEHLFDPRLFLHRAFDVLRPGGVLVLSTPYHGYLKNVALALSGRLDTHFTVLWDGGHIKFFSWPTLRTVLEGAGFVNIRFRGAGRVPFLWKSMVVSARRPSSRTPS